MTGPADTSRYIRSECVVFRKTKEKFGELSNMAAGFPIVIAGESYRTSEALYQCCRFPYDPALQQRIIAERSPMAAKMITKPHRKKTRPDWEQVKVQVMDWVLRVKLIQHWDAFGRILLESGESMIVEESRRDTFWGARDVGSEFLEGENKLGYLLVDLRSYRAHAFAPEPVAAPSIPHLLLLSQPVGTVPALQVDCQSEPRGGQQLELI